MNVQRSARCLAGPVLLVALIPGCMTQRPVAILARDAETNKPIQGAEIKLTYILTEPLAKSTDVAGKTGGDGVARLQTDPGGASGVWLSGNAKGYMFEQSNLAISAVRTIEPAHFFEAVTRRPVAFVVNLYADPRPTAELILPTGYRGLVKVEVKIKEDLPCKPGERKFHYEVPPSGEMVLNGPPVFRHAPDFSARYADGAAIPRNGNSLGFWWLKCEGEMQYFVVGSKGEYEAMHHIEVKDAPMADNPAPSKGAGSGGGGHHRHGGGGGQSSTAPGS